MSIEIEAKMRLSDPAQLQNRLRELDAVYAMTILEENTFFDTTTGALRASDRGLRLRIEKQLDGPYQQIIITHKGPRAHGKIKSRMEHEMSVTDAKAARELLVAIGFTPTLSFEKRRIRWHLQNCHVEIDTLPLIGTFVEIEGPSEAVILKLREELGLARESLVRTSYVAMLATHLSENHITTDCVRLEDSVHDQMQQLTSDSQTKTKASSKSATAKR